MRNKIPFWTNLPCQNITCCVTVTNNYLIKINYRTRWAEYGNQKDNSVVHDASNERKEGRDRRKREKKKERGERRKEKRERRTGKKREREKIQADPKMKFRRIPRLRIPANERFRLQESPGYNDRLQFCAFVCDKASAPGGLNKFHNTLHFDPRWIIRASAYLFTRDTCAPLYTAREFIKLSRAPLCRSSCTARAPYKYWGQLFFFRKDFPQIFRIFSPPKRSASKL